MKYLIPTLFLASLATAAEKKTEADYYKLISFPLPKDIVLEASGMDWFDKEQERLLVCTRRGELWLLDNVYGDDPAAETKYKRMLFGMHEPLGMLVNPGNGYPDGIYMAQRSELTRAVETNGDDRIDLVETFNQGWEISGSYHEYAFGPKIGFDGRMWVTLNRPFGGGQESKAHWRGWCVGIDKEGEMHPICTGLRSPAGLGTNKEGDMFFTDNQGDHVAAGKLGHLKPGAFQGNPEGINTARTHPKSNFKPPLENYPVVQNKLYAEAVKENPDFLPPAVWLPYPEMGRSHTDILWDSTGGKFGPFAGQVLVGDLSTATVLRVDMEKVGGEYQGACFPFLKGIEPPVLRMLWGKDGSLFVSGSSRGWGGGRRPYGLQRIVWTGETPFEVLTMRLRKEGFDLTFTKPVDPETASDPASYSMNIWAHLYTRGYGDKRHEEQDLEITKAEPSPDGKSVRLTIPGLKEYFIHALHLKGVRSLDGEEVLHPVGYYTLNRFPG